MTNPTEIIEMTATAYVSQFVYGVSKYYNADFFVTVIRLKRMYENEYVRKCYHSAIQPFKARILQ